MIQINKMEMKSMGEKRIKHDWICKYCGYKGNLRDLEERLYVFETKCGKCIECPKCETEQLI